MLTTFSSHCSRLATPSGKLYGMGSHSKQGRESKDSIVIKGRKLIQRIFFYYLITAKCLGIKGLSGQLFHSVVGVKVLSSMNV